MAWTTPYNWTNGEIVTETLMDTYVSDNLSYLNVRPRAIWIITGANYTTTSETLTDVDASNVKVTITANGGDMLVGLAGVGTCNNNQILAFNLDMDGSAVLPNSGLQVQVSNAGGGNVSFCYPVTGIASGAHTFKLQWASPGANTGTLYGSGSTVLWVKEI